MSFNYDKLSERQKNFYKIYNEFPFLLPRDSKGNIRTDFDCTNLQLEIPPGWYKLFLQMCHDIKLILVEENLLDKFYFLQVKEKFNKLCCYTQNSSVKIDQIISKYEHMAQYVCVVCGRPATYETHSYIASFCDYCWKDRVRHDIGEWITFKPYFIINSETEGVHCDEKHISFQDEWNRYLSKETLL